ncbi:uncharacterized protein LOC113508293 isoform X2 [Trichoplusia ni]|uniref:Uncharacterized protein LOC113508293 isoform X2 n=1 Tax=Trichoplusia ni TaxID=7111 RepID=A0A7E5X3S7_TRINI|nr:uncharacterized protein LOC113508293 isoform X2 [Trichoplusia ni]
MFKTRLCVLMMMFTTQIAAGQPLSCKEDTHCSEAYFCEIQSNICKECLRCTDLKRHTPKFNTSDSCIKSATDCGPCSEGFINVYRDGVKGKCVLPEFFEFGSESRYAYLWTSAAVVGFLIFIIFVYVIKRTQVFQVVAYYDPVSVRGSPQPDVVKTFSPRHLLKELLQFNTEKSSDIMQNM